MRSNASDTDYIRLLAPLDWYSLHPARYCQRLQLGRAGVASKLLAMIDLPALVFDARGKVLAANPLIKVLTKYIRWRAQDRVCLPGARIGSILAICSLRGRLISDVDRPQECLIVIGQDECASRLAITRGLVVRS